MLSGVNGVSPWAASAAESASHLVETALGQYSSRLVSEWSLPEGFDADEVSARMPDSPEVWSDGSMVLDSVTGVSAAGAGMFAHQSEFCWGGRRWGHVEHVHSVGVAQSCWALSLFLVHCRLFRGLSYGGSFLLFNLLMLFMLELIILVLFGMLDDCLMIALFSAPLELVNDGDLLILLRRMIDLRGSNTVRVTNVKGHADDVMVLHGRVRELDRLGNSAADEAADFGRRREGPAVVDARRNLSRVCGRRYPVILDLDRFFIAISRAVVNHDGRDGTAPDPFGMVSWYPPKRRRLVHAVSDRAFLPGPPGIWTSEWVSLPASVVCAENVALLAIFHRSLG